MTYLNEFLDFDNPEEITAEFIKTLDEEVKNRGYNINLDDFIHQWSIDKTPLSYEGIFEEASECSDDINDYINDVLGGIKAGEADIVEVLQDGITYSYERVIFDDKQYVMESLIADLFSDYYIEDEDYEEVSDYFASDLEDFISSIDNDWNEDLSVLSESVENFVNSLEEEFGVKVFKEKEERGG